MVLPRSPRIAAVEPPKRPTLFFWIGNHLSFIFFSLIQLQIFFFFCSKRQQLFHLIKPKRNWIFNALCTAHWHMQFIILLPWLDKTGVTANAARHSLDVSIFRGRKKKVNRRGDSILSGWNRSISWRWVIYRGEQRGCHGRRSLVTILILVLV